MNTKSVYNRKKYQRKVNKIVRTLNKSIQQDWLWNGRFQIRQAASYLTPYKDHSGAEFQFLLVCKDNKTGKITYDWFDNYNAEYAIAVWVNDVITNIFKVWDENPNPNQQARLAGRQPPSCKI